MPAYPTNAAERESWLLEGREIRFPHERPEEIKETDWLALRTIFAFEIASLFDPITVTAKTPISLHNVIISGKLTCRRAIAAADFRVTRSRFDNAVDFSGAQFLGTVDLSESRFQDEVRLRSAKFSYDLLLDLATFEKTSFFELIEVGGIFFAQGTLFHEVRLTASHFSKPATFGPKVLREGRVRRTAFYGDLLLREAQFDGSAEFSGVYFSKNVDFSRATIRTNLFLRAQFMATGKTPVRTWCAGRATFMDVIVNGAVDFNGAQFLAEVTLTRMRAGAGLFCGSITENGVSIRSHFRKDGWFEDVQITGRTVFSGTKFSGKCSFVAAQLKGDAFFNAVWRTNARFEIQGEAIFRGVSIDGTTDFTGATFGGPASFERARFGGNFYCGAASDPELICPLFRGPATFDDSLVRGAVFFSGADFQRDASFRRMQINSSAYFGPVDLASGLARTVFRGRSFFRELRIGGTADLIAVQFLGLTSWDRTSIGGSMFCLARGQETASFAPDSSFRDLEIRGVADFSGARFGGAVSFSRARIASSAFFSGAHFKGRLSFVDAQIQVIDFGGTEKDHARLPPTLDLQGLTYSRFNGNWEMLVARLPLEQLQPYTQLEKHFRGVAEEREADKVFVARRRKERVALRRQVFATWTNDGVRGSKFWERQFGVAREWLLNWALDRLFYYGLPCWRHLMVASGLIVVSFLLFLLPGSLTPKDKGTRLNDRREYAYAAAGAVIANLIPGESASELTAWKPSMERRPFPIGWTYFQWSAFLRYSIYALAGLGAAQLAALKKRHVT